MVLEILAFMAFLLCVVMVVDVAMVVAIRYEQSKKGEN